MTIDYSLIGLTLLGITIFISIIVVPFIMINKRKSGKNSSSGSNNEQVSGDGNSLTKIGTVNVYPDGAAANPSDQQTDKKKLSPDEIKNRVKVLFIDDKEFPVVDHLKSIGYKGVEYMEDVKDLDDDRIRYAHIIFVDINGVGVQMGFPNQGMGLCGAIKKRYHDQKRVILYSGETEGDIFDKDAKLADATLKKDSDIYQFISYITDYAQELL